MGLVGSERRYVQNYFQDDDRDDNKQGRAARATIVTGFVPQEELLRWIYWDPTIVQNSSTGVSNINS